MSPDDTEAIARAVDAAATVIDLPLRPDHRPGVVQFYALAARMAQCVLAVPMTHRDEPGHVFVPVEPEAGHGDR